MTTSEHSMAKLLVSSTGAISSSSSPFSQDTLGCPTVTIAGGTVINYALRDALKAIEEEKQRLATAKKWIASLDYAKPWQEIEVNDSTDELYPQYNPFECPITCKIMGSDSLPYIYNDGHSYVNKELSGILLQGITLTGCIESTPSIVDEAEYFQ